MLRTATQKNSLDPVLARMRQRLGLGTPRVGPAQSLRTIRAGGPGSGCHGPNCGRPGGPYGKLPGALSREDAKLLADPSWEAHEKHYKQAYGGVVVNKRGQFLLREPSGHFDGYAWTWPKGKMDSPDEHPVDVARREVREESGYRTKIFDQLPGTYRSGSDANNSFYLMKPRGHDASAMDDETRRTRWVSYADARRLIGRSTNSEGRKRDLAILDRAHKHLSTYNAAIAAGGPGSGCRGPNCGRPAGAAKPLGPKAQAHKILTDLGFKKLPGEHTFDQMKGKTGTGYQHPALGKVVVESKAFSHVHPVTGDFVKKPINTPAGMAGMQNHLLGLTGKPLGGPAQAQPTKTSSIATPPAPLVHDALTHVAGLAGYSKLYDNLLVTSYFKGVGAKEQSLYVYKDGSGFKHIDTDGVTTKGATADKLTALINKAPAGMAQMYKSPSGNTYQWQSGVGRYMPTTPGASGAVAKGLESDAIKYHVQKNGWQEHSDTSGTKPTPEVPRIAPVVPIVPVSRIPNDTATLKPGDFTYKQNKAEAGLGGAHDKYVFTDKQGKDWMFKPAALLGGGPDKVKAYADQVASKIQAELHPGFAVKAEAITLPVPGKGAVAGAIQEMVPKEYLRGEGGKYQSFAGRNFDTHPFLPWEVEHLQQEHVVDWLISNHDAHEGQFLRTSSKYPDGRGVIGIDKTQAFRYFGKDVLSTAYQPNTEKYGEKPPIYNKMWQDAKAGKINFDPDNTLKAIKRAEAIPDAKYREMLQPYAAAKYGGATPADAKARADFLADAVERKHDLRGDFEKFFSNVTGSEFKFDAPPTGEGKIAEKYPYKTNPDPKFTEEFKAPPLSEVHAAVAEAMGNYKSGSTLRQYDSAQMDVWASKGGNNLKTAVVAAKGLGVYPEVAAKFGLKASDMKELQSGWKAWSGSTAHGDKIGPLRQNAQELVLGKCCSDKIGVAMAVEHAVTRSLLLSQHPDGYVGLSRIVSGAVADKINTLAKKHPLVSVKLLNAEGWSDNKSFSGAARMHADIHVDHIISSYKTNPQAWAAHMSEHEYVVAIPGTWQQFQSHKLTK